MRINIDSTLVSYRAYGYLTRNDSTTYIIPINRTECGGIIQINHGFSNDSYSLYEFHLMNDNFAINKISGSDFIVSHSYSTDTQKLTIVLNTTWLRVRLIYLG